MTSQEADILRWMDWQEKPVSDTEILRQFPRLWPGFTAPLLQHCQIERDRRHYRITNNGRLALIAFASQSKYIPFEERKAR